MMGRAAFDLPLLLFLAVAAMAASAGCAGEAPSSSVDLAMDVITEESIRAPMRFLAHDLLEGREAGTPGYDIAAHYVASELESLGLEPLGDGESYFQMVPLRRARLDDARSSVVVTANGETEPLVLGEDVLLEPPLAGEISRAEGPLLFAGFGIAAPELDHDDYEELDPEGAVLVVLSGAPARFPSTERAVYSGELKLQQALDRGALGVLVVPTPTDETRRPWPLLARRNLRTALDWLDPDTGEPSGSEAELSVRGMIHQRAAARLLSASGRSLDDVFGSLDDGDVPRFELDATIAATSVASLEDFESPNVIARLPGGSRADEAVVYSAHLDHVGRGREIDGDDIYNGAYDNASGVAVLLAVARAFTETSPPPERSIVFLAATAEELGLLGSDFFAQHPTLPAESIVANVNADGALMLHPLRDVVPFGADHSTILEPVSRAAEELGIGLSPDFMPEEVIFIRSDQFSFVKRGIPAVYPFVGNDTGDERVDGGELLFDWMATRYHQPSDDMSQEMDFEAGADYAKLSYLIGYHIATSPERPAWNEGDFLGETLAR